MTDSEFATRYYDLMKISDIQSRISALDDLLKQAKASLVRQVVISPKDFYELGKRDLERMIDDTVYNGADGSFMELTYKDRYSNSAEYYCYKGDWIDIPYMYNAAKDSMTKNLDRLASCNEARSNIVYILHHCECQELDLWV